MADYSKLRAVLEAAYDQSANGKGKARHANGRDFDRQPILEIGRMVGPGYATGQLMKKAQEAVGMVARCDHRAAVSELLGSIVYAAAAVVLIEEHHAEFDRNVQMAAAEVEKDRARVAGGGLPAAPSKFETGVEKRMFTDAATRLREAADRVNLSISARDNALRGWAPGDVIRDEVPLPVNSAARGHDGLTHAERIAGLEGGLREAVLGAKRQPADSHGYLGGPVGER